MKGGAGQFSRVFWSALALAAIISWSAEASRAQSSGLERSFPQSKATVEKALNAMQGATAGRLPVVDGFATSADHPLDRYQRGYYQSKFQVSAAASGGSSNVWKRASNIA